MGKNESEIEFFKKVRNEFPIFENNKKLIYLDSAATTQKPKCVIDAITNFYSKKYGTVHRGIYDLSIEATSLYDETRQAVQQFINAKSKDEIIFTKGTTESINLIARTIEDLLDDGDEIIITQMEHHSNIVPWQLLQKRKNIKLKVVPIDENANLKLDILEKMLSNKTKLISIAHITNSTGTINPIKEIVQMAKAYNTLVMIDGAQAASHIKLDMQDLDVDLYAFSAHKMYGPNGVGILYGKKKILDQLPPFLGGGDMIEKVTFEKTTFKESPEKFEAGTPAIADVIAFKNAIEFLENIGLDKIASYEELLTNYAIDKMKTIVGLEFIGNPQKRGSLISFVLKGKQSTIVHPMDLATFLNLKHIAIRSGHLCAQPLLEFYKQSQISRISFGIYNTFDEIDTFVKAVNDILKTHYTLPKQ
jgi:cysteine desulfurase / selenocysteine lyase